MNSTVSTAAALLRQAAAAGRDRLNDAELRALLGALGIDFGTEPAPAAAGAGFRIGLTSTREFGMVIHAGLAGVDGALGESNFRRDRGSVCAVAELTDGADFLALFRRTLACQKLAAAARRRDEPSPDPALQACFTKLLDLAKQFAPGTPGASFVLQTLELDPVHVPGQVIARAARCEFGPPQPGRLPRPIAKIDKAIHPKSIGIIGVSASGMNFGRIILRNVLGSGYPKEQMVILRPGETEIDGVRCVAGLAALEAKLDLLIVAIAASAVYELVDEIIESDAVEAVMLIPGGLGETAASREPAAALARHIDAAHARPGGGPIFLGANVVGVVSHPGGYDSWFIPLERLPKPKKKPVRNSVLLSQSGAFMISRLSQNPWLDPAYAIALGNQTDATHGDALKFFAEVPGIETIGIYVEGFRDLDGLEFARAVRRAVLNGKQIVVYKSGRTAAGRSSILGHTASIAGEMALFDSVVRHAGAIVAEDVSTFDDLLYIAGALHGKKIGGRRLGALSGSGFECISMADSTESDTFRMEMGALEPRTVAKVQAILAAKKLDQLVEVRNPIDINPGADDEAHLDITAAFLEDPNIDAVVVGLDPTAPSVRALESSKLRPGHDLSDPKGTVHLMPPLAERHDKPVIGVVDGGRLYDAMSAALMDRGVCVFRNAARGTQALVRYVEARLYARALQERTRN